VANQTTWNTLRQTASPASTVDRIVWQEFPGDMPPKLVGVPAYQASGMLSSQTTGADIACIGNFAKGAVVVDRVGTGTVLYQPNVLIGAQRRPTGSVAVYAMWRSTFAVVAPQAFQMVRCL
jgi:HK97 family phage major capsid protein